MVMNLIVLTKGIHIFKLLVALSTHLDSMLVDFMVLQITFLRILLWTKITFVAVRTVMTIEVSSEQLKFADIITTGDAGENWLFLVYFSGKSEETFR